MSTLKTNNIQHVDRSDPSIIINTDGSVNIAGTMTYEDVTNVDAVGIITGRSLINAQKQVHVGTGVSVKAGGLNVTAGISTFGGDVSIARDIIHTGDTDTLMRFDTDTIKFDTGGATRFTLTGGNVIQQSGTFIIKNASSDSNGIKISQESSNESRIFNHFSGPLTFGTTNIERMRIDNNGKVLIATDTTSEANANNDELIIGKTTDDANHGLTIVTPSNRYGTVAFSDGSGGTNRGLLEYNHSTDFFRIYVAGSERLRIDSSGRLLVGTTETSSNQSGALNVFGTDGNTAFASIRRGSNNASGPRLALCKSRNTTDGAASGLLSNGDILGTIHFYGNDSQGFEEGAAIAANIDGTPGSNDLPTRLTFSTTPDGSDTKVERLRIDSAGRVIITNDGVTNPTGTNTQYAPLVVRGNTSATSSRAGWLTLARSEASANVGSGEGIGEIYFGDQQAGEYGSIKCFADATAAVGDYPGRLSFWTTADGGSSLTERMRIDSSGHIHVKGTNKELRFYRDDDARYGAITYDGGQFNIKNPVNDNTQVTKSDGTLHTRFDNGGNLTLSNGSLVIGTNGKGIDFSANTNDSNDTSELLDDYEEGTCNPTQVNGSFTPSASDGKYIKVGKLVTWMMHIVFDSTASNNHLQIGNLPFTAGGGRAGGAIIRYSNDDEAYEICWHVDGGAATATAYYLNGGGTVASNAASQKRYDLTFVYEAAS